ncbi:hypothetical protein [Yinghuangia sp. YIM S10712]|uniref:hypothetical protein n=1 Tax=Yinghuangia sp. YIM S10712 TaxID=3436930 RepID=UPI003F536B8D
MAFVIRIVTAVVVGILVLHILLVLLEANPANDLVSTLADWANGLSGWSEDLFTPDGYKARIFVNEGLAAVVYVLIGGVLSRAATRI